MELRQLRYFLAVARELHFGRAAKKMNISQPPLSQQIKQLEEELEIKLFNRSSRFVELTTQGEFFKEEVEKALKDIDKAAKTAKEIGRGKKGPLKIGFVALITQSGFPELIKEYKKKNPKVNIELNDLSSSKQLELISRNRLDIGFINSFKYNISGFSYLPYIEGEYKIAIPENHRLVKKDKISPKNLRGENIIMFKRIVQPALYDSIIEVFKKGGAESFTTQDINQRITSLALVAAGMGVCPVSSPVQHLRKKGIVYKNIEGEFPKFEISAVWAKENDSPRLKSFLKLLKKTPAYKDENEKF